jgi:hypothetical protein
LSQNTGPNEDVPALGTTAVSPGIHVATMPPLRHQARSSFSFEIGLCGVRRGKGHSVVGPPRWVTCPRCKDLKLGLRGEAGQLGRKP